MPPPAEQRAVLFDVVTVVWGEEFRRLFLEVCVPNQLTPGNLGALPAGSRYRVFTAPEDAPMLHASQALDQVQEVIPVDIVSARHLSASAKNRFSRMTACHRQALLDARARNAAVIFLCADHLLSEGAFAAVVRQRAKGVRAMVCTGIRVEIDGFVAALRARGGVSGVPSRELVSVALGHLHPFTHAHTVDGRATTLRPIGIYWRVPGQGLLARCFNLHPLMLDPVRPEVLPEDTIDGHFVRRSCPDRAHVHVAADSDELVVFEMSRADEAVVDVAPGGISPWRAATMLGRCDSHQEWYFRRQPIRLHAGEIGCEWTAADSRAARFVTRAVALARARRWFSLRHVRQIGHLDGSVGKPFRRAFSVASKRVRRVIRVYGHAANRGARRLGKRAARAGRRAMRGLRPA